MIKHRSDLNSCRHCTLFESEWRVAVSSIIRMWASLLVASENATGKGFPERLRAGRDSGMFHVALLREGSL